jgi:uncharacterized protein (DUF427 family)
MKQPGSDHPITIAPNPRRVRVILGDAVLADTTRALTLKEAEYKPVQYIPRADIDMGAFKPTEHHSHCPYKGDASYFTITADSRSVDNAAWSYELPYPAVSAIKDHLAFYPNRVDKIEESDA